MNGTAITSTNTRIRTGAAIRLAVLYLDAWLVARALPFLIYMRSFEAILASVEAEPSGRYTGLPADRIANAVKRVTRHPWLMRKRRCFREGLIGYRYLRLAGHSPQLHFSVKNLADAKLAAHCWIVLDGKAIVNDAHEDMTTVYIHSGPRRAG